MKKVVDIKSTSTIDMIDVDEQQRNMWIYEQSEELMSSRRKDLDQHVVEFDSDFVDFIHNKQYITIEQMLGLEDLARDIVNSYLSSDFANIDDYEMMRVKLHMQLRKDAGLCHYESSFFAENQLYYNFKHNQFLKEHEEAA